MCQFFSLVSNGKGKVFYFDVEIRRKIRNGDLDYNQDSHTSIADYFGFKGAKEDTLNKYEYNPLTKELTKDQINTRDDSEKVVEVCNSLDFKTIIPELIIKPIINPFIDIQNGGVTPNDIELLKEWASVWDSVRASVGASVWDSVRASVGDSVWDSVRASVGASVRDSVWDSVRASVRDSVWDSVRASVRDSVWDSVRASVWASVWAYVASFFHLKQWKYIDHIDYENPFQPCITLWEKGLIPSFDGITWRLHGAKGVILWEGKF